MRGTARWARNARRRRLPRACSAVPKPCDHGCVSTTIRRDEDLSRASQVPVDRAKRVHISAVTEAPRLAKGAHLRAGDGPDAVTVATAALLWRDCESRRCACCRPDLRRPPSAPRCRSRGRAATLTDADIAPGPDDWQECDSGLRGGGVTVAEIVRSDTRGPDAGFAMGKQKASTHTGAHRQSYESIRPASLGMTCRPDSRGSSQTHRTRRLRRDDPPAPNLRRGARRFGDGSLFGQVSASPEPLFRAFRDSGTHLRTYLLT